MPGYRPLPAVVKGEAADSVRTAAALTKTGDPIGAAHLLEDALAASLEVTPEMPGWLCGRLAVLYRRLGRLEDEVDLLERYRASQPTDEARTRFDARLSKARAILARKRPKDSGALTSVRQALERPRRARRGGTPSPNNDPVKESDRQLTRLRELFAITSSSAFETRLEEELRRYLGYARKRELALEVMVETIRTAAKATDTSGLTASTSRERFSVALVRLLALSFNDD